MSHRSPSRKPTLRRPAVERRAPRGKPGSLSWLRGLMGRPLALERRGGRLQMGLVERRRNTDDVESRALDALRQELQTRLMAHDMTHAARVMRHLAFVHDELGRHGWAGVARLPAQALGKAQVQAEMLHGRQASPLLAELVDRLRLLKAAAEVREEAQALRATGSLADPLDLEVSETTQEEFEETERSWAGTLPQGLAKPDPPG